MAKSNKYLLDLEDKHTLNFNPKMWIPVNIDTIE
jgi:hypothetical protein